MNKLKVLYDVVMAMKEKEVFTGNLTAQVTKDEARVFFLTNDFTKNIASGQTKAKIVTELDYEGKTVKHESSTEFAMPRGGGCRHHGFMRHHMHHGHGGCCGGIKGKLSRLAFALGVLNALKVEEQENKNLGISLAAADLPEDLKARLRERLSRAEECQHRGHAFMKEFCGADDIDFAVTVFLTKNNEVEKAVATCVGTRKDGRETTARAELSLVW
jgi:hypothetical protein